MALVKCSDCGHRVSTSAAACPQCGNPTRARRAARTIEATGKRWKLQLLLSSLIVIVSIVVLIAAANSEEVAREYGVVAFLAFIIGFFWYLCARLGSWWFHG